MLRFSANLTMLFTDVPFTDRFGLAASHGFKGVEFLFPYAFKADQLAGLLKSNNLEQVLHNLPAGDWDAGERGIACIPGREAEFQEGVGRAIEYAKALGCKQLNCLAGKTPQDGKPGLAHETLVKNLQFAAKELGKQNIRLLVEGLNSRDVKGFYLVRTADVLSLLADVDHPNVYLQYDVYHMQIMEGNLTTTIRENLPRIAHIQIADVPGRHEPGTGEINYANLFRFIDEAGYGGWIGCEYNPAGKTFEGLSWMNNYRQ
jgi:hydroxypyruvate isomerase